MSNPRQGAKITCLSAAAANGVGTEVDVSKYRHIGVAIIGASTPTLTVKAQGSYEMTHNASLDFSAAASATNPWDYVGMYDMEDGAFTDGDTGIAFAGSNDVRLFMINTDCLRSVNFIVSGYSAGAVTVIVYPIQST